MKVVVVDESYLINKDIKMGDVCEVTEVGWFEYHPAVLVTKPNGSSERPEVLLSITIMNIVKSLGDMKYIHDLDLSKWT